MNYRKNRLRWNAWQNSEMCIRDSMYSDKKEIVHKLEEELNVPTIYMFNSENNRFLDDILLFSKINESYKIGRAHV